jgi:hypothetical protein
MLNELFELNKSRRSAGIVTQSWHKNFGTCPKNKTYILLLAPDGTVCDIEPINDIEKIKSYRKWEIAAGTSFPAFNVPPLYWASSQNIKDKAGALKKNLQAKDKLDGQKLSADIDALLLQCESLWTGNEAERITRCLQAHPQKLSTILDDPPPEFKAVNELIQRAARLDAGKLQDGIRAAIIRRLTQQPNDAKGLFDTFLVSSAANNNGIKKVSLVLELADRSYSKALAWINSQLMAHDAPTTPVEAKSAMVRDAFGQPLADLDFETVFPEISLSKLGKIKLRAMSSESPCQKRYGMAESKSFPAGSQIRQEMKDSLEWLGDPARRGKTWQDASGVCGFSKRDGKKVPIPGILFAYPSTIQDDPPELAGLFVGEESRDKDGAKFEAAAARVTPALQGIVRDHPNAEIRVFVLFKPDGYRTKILVTRTYTATRLISAAQEWQDGCCNIPVINLNIGTKEEGLWITPLVPFPAEVVKSLNITWLQGGARPDPVHGLGVGEGIALLMESSQEGHRTTEKALRLAVSNAGPLLLALGHADHRGDGSFKLNSRYARHANLLPSLLGLFLFQLGNMKGGYMAMAPFLVGRMLALADTLHKEYCQHVRKKNIPPQLIGNALMPVALENPNAGLARLSERIAIYQAWANTASGEGLGLAKWALQQIGLVASELGGQTLPDCCNDVAKAQMLLGYLARPERKSDIQPETIQNVTGGNE